MAKLYHPSHACIFKTLQEFEVCTPEGTLECSLLPGGTRDEMLLALPQVGSTFPMLACCMVGESKTNLSATLTSPPVNSLR